jgi:general secretion pathway protein E
VRGNQAEARVDTGSGIATDARAADPRFETPPPDAFGAHLLETGRLAPAALERAENAAGESGERLGVVLTRLGLVSERELAEALADFLHLPLAVAADFPDTPVLEDRFNRKFLREAQVIPLADEDDSIAIAMVNPLDNYAMEAVRFACGKRAAPRVALPADFEAAYEALYGEGKSEIRQLSDQTAERQDTTAGDDVERLKDSASEAPVIRLVNVLITRAVEARASDIHVEPMDGELRVRYRIDGVLHEVEAPPRRLAAAIISRIKIMAKLNIAERRLSQDGRIRLAVRGKDIDFRVSTTPTIHGESVVLRILDRSSLKLDFEALGFDEDLTLRLRAIIEVPHGILLVTGPTGSGKTTTLYTALLELNTAERKILTIEDPVEYHLKGVNQVQVKPQIGLTFAGALRSFLRQDPDIMMIGEIRDLETAHIAVQAALTGHLILSTLHTNDAATAVTRLLDMGVEDYLLTSTVNGLVAQRLVRLLCEHCREAYDALPEFVDRLKLGTLAGGPVTLWRPRGCERCGGTGYFGRTSIVEVLPMTDAIRQLVLCRAEAGTIRKTAIEAGMQSLHMHGMRKALAGATTVEDVLRATRMA